MYFISSHRISLDLSQAELVVINAQLGLVLGIGPPYHRISVFLSTLFVQKIKILLKSVDFYRYRFATLNCRFCGLTLNC